MSLKPIPQPNPGTQNFKKHFEKYIKYRIKKDKLNNESFTIECSLNKKKKEFAYQKVVRWCIGPEQPYIHEVNGSKLFTFRNIKFKRAIINWRTGSGKTLAMISILNNFRDSFMPIIVCFTRSNERNNFLNSLINIDNHVGRLLKLKLKNKKKEILGTNKLGDVLQWSCICGKNNNKNVFCSNCRGGHPNLFKSLEPDLKQVCNSKISLLTYTECGGTNYQKLYSALTIKKNDFNITKNAPDEMIQKVKKNKNFNFTVLICDEVHNFFDAALYQNFKNDVKNDYKIKQKKFLESIKESTNCYFYGFSATPVQYQLNENKKNFEKRCNAIFKFLKSGKYYQLTKNKPQKITYQTNDGFMFLYHPDLHTSFARTTFPSIISKGALDANEMRCEMNYKLLSEKDTPSEIIRNMIPLQKYLFKMYMFNAYQKLHLKTPDYQLFNQLLKENNFKQKNLKQFQLIYYKNKYIKSLNKTNNATKINLIKYNFIKDNNIKELQEENKIKILRSYMNVTGQINDDNQYGISNKLFEIINKIKENVKLKKKTLVIAPGKYYMFKTTIQTLSHLLDKDNIKYIALRSNTSFFESTNKYEVIENNPNIISDLIIEALDMLNVQVNKKLNDLIEKNCRFYNLINLDENSKFEIDDGPQEDELMSNDTDAEESDFDSEDESESEEDLKNDPDYVVQGGANLTHFIKSLINIIKKIINQSNKEIQDSLKLQSISIDTNIEKVFKKYEHKLDMGIGKKLKNNIKKFLILYREREMRMGSTAKERRIIVTRKMNEFNSNNNFIKNENVPYIMVINENFMESTSFLGSQQVIFLSPPKSYTHYLQYKGRCIRACASHITNHFTENQNIEFLIYVSTFNSKSVEPLVRQIYKKFENVVDTRQQNIKYPDKSIEEYLLDLLKTQKKQQHDLMQHYFLQYGIQIDHLVEKSNSAQDIQNQLKQKASNYNESKKKKETFNYNQLISQEKLIKTQKQFYSKIKERIKYQYTKFFLDFVESFINLYDSNYKFTFYQFRNIKKTCVLDKSNDNINLNKINFEFKKDCWVHILEHIFSIKFQFEAGQNTDSDSDSSESINTKKRKKKLTTEYYENKIHDLQNTYDNLKFKETLTYNEMLKSLSKLNQNSTLEPVFEQFKKYLKVLLYAFNMNICSKNMINVIKQKLEENNKQTINNYDLIHLDFTKVLKNKLINLI